MNTGEERVLSELQSALNALTKASEHLERASQENTASGVSRKVAGAKGLLKELQQEVSYLMHLASGEGQTRALAGRFGLKKASGKALPCATNAFTRAAGLP